MESSHSLLSFTENLKLLYKIKSIFKKENKKRK